MQLEQFVAAMEAIAPPELAEEYDNVGLLVGPDHTNIRRVLVALDCSLAVAKEAAEMQADLVLTHHPQFFAPVQRILPDDPQTAAVYALIRNGIGLYAAHTNLDAATGGVNDILAARLGLTHVASFGDGLGRIGTLPAAIPLGEFAAQTAGALNARVSFCGNGQRSIHRAAVVGGAGASLIADAKAAGADVLVTGEAKHHEGHAADVLDLPMIVAGHYETEKVILEPLIARLQSVSDDVQYKIALADMSPFAQL